MKRSTHLRLEILVKNSFYPTRIRRADSKKIETTNILSCYNNLPMDDSFDKLVDNLVAHRWMDRLFPFRSANDSSTLPYRERRRRRKGRNGGERKRKLEKEGVHTQESPLIILQSHSPVHLLSFPTCLHLVNPGAREKFCIPVLIIAIASYIFMALQNRNK